MITKPTAKSKEEWKRVMLTDHLELLVSEGRTSIAQLTGEWLLEVAGRWSQSQRGKEFPLSMPVFLQTLTGCFVFDEYYNIIQYYNREYLVIVCRSVAVFHENLWLLQTKQLQRGFLMQHLLPRLLSASSCSCSLTSRGIYLFPQQVVWTISGPVWRRSKRR